MTDRMRVLLATDDSVAARAAEPWLTQGRWSQPPRVEVLTVAAPAISSSQWLARIRSTDIRSAIHRLEERERARAAEVADQVAARLQASGVDAIAHARSGEPAAEILAQARALSPELIVIGPRGRSELTAALLGSVSMQVLAHAEQPVLVARAGGMVAGSLPKSIALMVDGSLGARVAIEWLARAGWLSEASVVLRGLLGIHAGLDSELSPSAEDIRGGLEEAATEALTHLAEVIGERAGEIATEVEMGHPLHAALAAESAHLADLLVVTRRRPRPGDHPLADKMARYATTSVMVVPIDDTGTA
jgi:nucleotide-binding universal stress UspA family protein